jgi:hypothetical protein
MVAEICNVGATVLVPVAVVAAKAAVDMAIIPSAKIVKYFFILRLSSCMNPRPEATNTQPSTRCTHTFLKHF